VISDRANGYRELIAFVRERLAHVVVRFCLATLPLHNAQGQCLRCTMAETARAAVTALLVGWALLEEEGQQMRWTRRCSKSVSRTPHLPVRRASTRLP
jgi:hypothetical protein